MAANQPEATNRPMPRILDTTLRDGEQTPGVYLNPEKKLLIAQKLDDIGVTVIEAGSAVVSEEERQAIKKITSQGMKAKISSFTRVLKKDIDYAIECDVDMISMVVPTSDLHIEHKLRMNREQVIRNTNELVDHCKAHGLIVEILAEDGSRTTREQLIEHFSGAELHKADRVCVCDTVGVFEPRAVGELYSFLGKNLKVPLAFHGHNDLGCAVANSLAAYDNGANELHCTINGLGERAGNASLEEIAVALYHFRKLRVVELEKLFALSKLTESLTGIRIAHNKPLVGSNAFTHESGIHVDGILKNQSTYEPISPELVGQKRKIELGKHSGRKAIAMRLEQLGMKLSEEQIATLTERTKKLGESGKHVSDADVIALAFDILGTAKVEKLKLDEFIGVSGSTITPFANVKVDYEGKKQTFTSIGNGPVDAAINAIRTALPVQDIEFVDYSVDAITGGTNALVNVKIVLRRGTKEITSNSTASDIVQASIEAFVKGVNLLL